MMSPEREKLWEAHYHSRAAHEEAMRAYVLLTEDLPHQFHIQQAVERLTSAANALGYVLVRTKQAAAPAPATVTILPLDPEEEAA